MKNQLLCRKVPHARRSRNVFDWDMCEYITEDYIATRMAYAFEVDGDFSSAVVYKEVPLSHCFVKSGLQEVSDYDLRPQDMRSWTVDVHTARQMNCDKGLGWMTDWEIEQAELTAKREAELVLDRFLKD